MNLSEKDLEIFRRIDGLKTVAEIAEEDPGAADRIRELCDADILDLIPPADRVSAPHLVVIEPHMDDAALSVGGRLLHRRGKNRITILSVMKYSNFTSYWNLNRDFLDVETVTSLRLGESALAARLFGAEHRCLDWRDAPIRLYPENKWSAEELERILPTIYSYMEIPPDPKEISVLKDKLRIELEKLEPDEIWIPMGLGTHLDHRTVRSACVAMLSEWNGRIEGSSVCIYEDLPYNRPSLASQIRESFERHGSVLQRCTEDITDVFEEKLRAVSVFASQFKRSYMEPRIRHSAERGDRGAEGRLEEVYYRVEGGITSPPESEMAPNRDELERERRRARSLSGDPAKFRRFEILATPSANLGRWRADCDRLLALFPHAVIRLVLPEEMRWQIFEPGNERIEIVVSGRGVSGWIREALKLLVRPGAVLLVLWWGAGRDVRGWKGIALEAASALFRKTVFAQSLGDLCLLLEEEKGGNS